MAVASEHIAADVVDVETLPELAERHAVKSVPTLLVDGAVELLGTQSESGILEAISRRRV